MHTAPRQRGFSLLELVLVIAILAVLAGLVIPALAGRSERAHLESNGLRLQALARLASSYAIKNGRSVRLELYVEPSEVRFGMAEGSYPLAEDFENIPIHWARPFVLDGRTSFNETVYYGEEACNCLEANHVHFYADGSADPCEMRLSSPEGETLAIRVARTTSRLKLLRLWQEASE